MRLRLLRRGDCAKDLPAGAREAEFRNQAIARGQKSAIQPEKIEYEARQGLAGWRSLCLTHLSPLK